MQQRQLNDCFGETKLQRRGSHDRLLRAEGTNADLLGVEVSPAPDLPAPNAPPST